jgi:hypothetical protein
MRREEERGKKKEEERRKEEEEEMKREGGRRPAAALAARMEGGPVVPAGALQPQCYHAGSRRRTGTFGWRLYPRYRLDAQRYHLGAREKARPVPLPGGSGRGTAQQPSAPVMCAASHRYLERYLRPWYRSEVQAPWTLCPRNAAFPVPWPVPLAEVPLTPKSAQSEPLKLICVAVTCLALSPNYP